MTQDWGTRSSLRTKNGVREEKRRGEDGGARMLLSSPPNDEGSVYFGGVSGRW